MLHAALRTCAAAAVLLFDAGSLLGCTATVFVVRKERARVSANRVCLV